MKNEEIMTCCLNDREHVYKNSKNIIKFLNLDLYIKQYILLINVFGKNNCKNRNNVILFLDEIKNTNMHNNLNDTYKMIDCKKFILNFYELKSENHLKIGIIYPIISMITIFLTTLLIIPVLLIAPKKFAYYILLIIYRSYSNILKKINSVDTKYVVMSDHHFFSTICSCKYEKQTFVLQHGLVMDKTMYYPLRAGHFLAWGENTKEILENDPKVIITGTYKFSKLKENNTISPKRKQKRKILFCISSLDLREIERKINILLVLSENMDFELIIKCHPGSLFDLNYWKSKYKNMGIIFYKEEQINNLEFDIAISENSTVNLDLLMLNKMFIIFDSKQGYFGKYFSVIPNGNDMNTIQKCIKNIENYKYTQIYDFIIRKELNNNRCDIKNILEGNNNNEQ